jgi:hypothetical protein
MKVVSSDQMFFLTKRATDCTNLSDDNIITTIREITQTIFTTHLYQFISTNMFVLYALCILCFITYLVQIKAFLYDRK